MARTGAGLRQERLEVVLGRRVGDDEDCARAAEAVLPGLTTWALEGCGEARTWALALAAHHPAAWASLGVDAARLMPGAGRAKTELVRHAVSGTRPGEHLVAEVLAAEPELRDYYDEVISETPEDRHARMMVLELAVAGRL